MIRYFLPLALALLPLKKDPLFEPQVIDAEISIGYGLAIGDVDGDGKPDILLADKKQFVWYRNGDWKRFVMAENLTENDNVCIAARDIDGDGKVEVAVGAQWLPSETSDTVKSGSVHYLIRPVNPGDRWTAVALHHEPTIHRMRWVRTGKNNYQLVVVPLHGRGNVNGGGTPVKVIAYEKPADPRKPWKYRIVDQSMHVTHNLDVVPGNDRETIFIGGKEGVHVFSFVDDRWTADAARPWMAKGRSFGEVRMGRLGKKEFLAGIEPMHGHQLTFYSGSDSASRTVLNAAMNQGHALATADLMNLGRDQLVVGWRERDAEGNAGIKLFVPDDEKGNDWKEFWIDKNEMACEDLKVADLNADGKPDIVAAGRATHNLKIYWNRN
jgi:hypothetical protein